MIGCSAKKWSAGACTTFKNRTDMLTSFQRSTGQLKQAHTCANFPPSRGAMDERYNMSRLISYLAPTSMWVQAFRKRTFTLPFTEDYIFQIAAGSQQMFVSAEVAMPCIA